jgi:ATP-dependent helicase HrpB
MARYPLHPRLSRLMVEARRRGVARDGCAVAALLSAGERLPAHAPHKSRSDLLVLLEGEWSSYAARLFRQLEMVGRTPWSGCPLGQDAPVPLPAPRTQHLAGCEQADGGVGRGPGRPPHHQQRAAEGEAALLISILTAFPDRVARRRQGADVQLAIGTAAELAPNSTVTDAELFVAVEAEDRQDRKAPLVRLASAIEPEWLLDLFPDRLREVSTLQWNRAGERVEAVTSLMFDQIAIETRRTPPDAEQAGVFLAHQAVEAGLGRFADLEEIAAFQARVQFAAQHGAVAELDAVAIEAALAQLATGLKSFAELDSATGGGNLLREIERRMPPGTRRLLEEIAPASIRLPRGRQVPVHYEPGQPPWIASRLQDFFGMRQTPAVGRGAVPVVVRLLGPNQRPVQVTSDLAGFWQRLYPQVRKELSRRYPKHAWPENPLG